MTTFIPQFPLRRILTLLPVIGLLLVSGCGGGGTSGGANIFVGDCRISDPNFPFCGGNWVRCRNQDMTLYQVYDGACPAGWTIVPDAISFPMLACTNPEGQTFNVDADQCPAGWTKFTITF